MNGNPAFGSVLGHLRSGLHQDQDDSEIWILRKRLRTPSCLAVPRLSAYNTPLTWACWKKQIPTEENGAAGEAFYGRRQSPGAHARYLAYGSAARGSAHPVTTGNRGKFAAGIEESGLPDYLGFDSSPPPKYRSALNAWSHKTSFGEWTCPIRVLSATGIWKHSWPCLRTAQNESSDEGERPFDPRNQIRPMSSVWCSIRPGLQIFNERENSRRNSHASQAGSKADTWRAQCEPPQLMKVRRRTLENSGAHSTSPGAAPRGCVTDGGWPGIHYGRYLSREGNGDHNLWTDEILF